MTFGDNIHPCKLSAMDPEMASDGNRAQDPTMWRDRLFTSGYFSIHSSLQFSLSSFCLYPSVSFSLPFLHYLLTPINVTQGIRVSEECFVLLVHCGVILVVLSS